MNATLKILCDEHSALGSVLRTLPLLLPAPDDGRTPDFTLLRAMLFYIAEFPEKRHHRKESDLLFPKLRARSLSARPLLDRLDEEHARGEFRIRELEHLLTAWELLGDRHREPFETAARRYVEFYLAHMALEEHEIMPLALEVLSLEDWDELDAAIDPEPDPLVGLEAELEYRALFEHIVYSVPPPLGLGRG